MTKYYMNKAYGLVVCIACCSLSMPNVKPQIATCSNRAQGSFFMKPLKGIFSLIAFYAAPSIAMHKACEEIDPRNIQVMSDLERLERSGKLNGRKIVLNLDLITRTDKQYNISQELRNCVSDIMDRFQQECTTSKKIKENTEVMNNVVELTSRLSRDITDKYANEMHIIKHEIDELSQYFAFHSFRLYAAKEFQILEAHVDDKSKKEYDQLKVEETKLQNICNKVYSKDSCDSEFDSNINGIQYEHEINTIYGTYSKAKIVFLKKREKIAIQLDANANKHYQLYYEAAKHNLLKAMHELYKYQQFLNS